MQLYIDPGTGSMLFTILAGLIGTAVYSGRKFFMKLWFRISGGSQNKQDKNTIPFAIFADDKRYWNVFEPICREFESRGEPVTYMTASPDDPALRESFEHVQCKFIGEGNKAYARLNVLNADVLLSTTPGLEVYQWKRSKDVKHYCHILHAASDATLYRMFGLDFYDSVLLSGEYQVSQIRNMEKIRSLPAKELAVVGQPYMDELLKRLENTPLVKNETTTVLLAPSWGPSSLLNKYGEKVIDALADTGYNIIIRPHPQSFVSEKELIDKLMAKYPDIEWNRDADNFDVLNHADILISDFSGVIFDFALVFNKPVIYTDTDFDKSPYDAWWIEKPTWTFDILPKIGTMLTEKNFLNIREIIDSCLNNKKYQQGIEQARKEAWDHIGESAKLTVDFLINKRNELIKSEEIK